MAEPRKQPGHRFGPAPKPAPKHRQAPAPMAESARLDAYHRASPGSVYTQRQTRQLERMARRAQLRRYHEEDRRA